MKSRVFAVAGLLFLSGTCALVFQIAWLREFRLVFGATTAASAAVLAIFMGGLGLGNGLLGPRVDRHPNPLRFYATLELFIAVTAALSPFLIDLIRWIYIGLGGQLVLGFSGATVVRLLLSTLVLAVPTFLMGGTLPAAVRALTTAADPHRHYVAVLYGVNTFGAVLGAGLGTFVMLEAFGTRTTLWLACVVNLLTSLAAFAVSRILPAEPPDVAAPEQRANVALAWDPSAVMPPSLVYVSAGVLGFAFFLMELVWYRMLSPILGGTTFTFGLILIMVLLGIGLGGAAYSFLLRWRRPTIRGFALTCGLEAAAIAIPYALGDRIAILAVILKDLSVYGFYGEAVGWAAVAAVVVLPAAFISGVQFPLLISLAGQGRKDVGRQVGLAFAANTLGAILGSLAGGFGLLPTLTAPGAWCAVVALLAALSAAVILLSLLVEGVRGGLIVPVLVVAASLVSLQATGPTALWRHSSIGAGRARLPGNTKVALRSWSHNVRRRTVWEAEGVESSVAIHISDGLAFLVNGKSDGSATADASTQIMLGIVGALLHPEPKTGLVVGLGTGETTGWLAEVPSVDEVQVVEVEPVVDEVARLCSPVNHDVLNHPKVRRVYNDAREVLLTSPLRYDVIASEPSNPYRAGVASLYTREFYQAVHDRLNDRGLFLQWLQAYEIDTPTVGTVLATLGSVFDHVEIWQTNPTDLLLVCSAKPIAYPVPEMRERLTQEPFKSALAVAWRAVDLEGFLSRYVGGPSTARAVVDQVGAPINTDDRNQLEYASARSVGRETGFSIVYLRELAVLRADHRPTVRGEIDWDAVEDQRLEAYFHHGQTLPLHSGITPERAARGRALLQFQKGDMRGAIAAWNAQPREPVYPTELGFLAVAYAESADDKALPLIERLREFNAVEAEAIKAFLLWRQKKSAEATDALSRAFIGMRENPWPHYIEHAFTMAVRLASEDPAYAQRLYEAIGTPFAVFKEDERRRNTACIIAVTLNPVTAAECIATYEPFVPWSKEFLQRRSEVYSAAGHPLAAQAKQDLQDYMAQMPADIKLDSADDVEPNASKAAQSRASNDVQPPSAK